MGEIADAMINGECCAICGQYFIKEPKTKKEKREAEKGVITVYQHGYPVACKECWEEDCGYPEATADTI